MEVRRKWAEADAKAAQVEITVVGKHPGQGTTPSRAQDLQPPPAKAAVAKALEKSAPLQPSPATPPTAASPTTPPAPVKAETKIEVKKEEDEKSDIEPPAASTQDEIPPGHMAIPDLGPHDAPPHLSNFFQNAETLLTTPTAAAASSANEGAFPPHIEATIDHLAASTDATHTDEDGTVYTGREAIARIHALQLSTDTPSDPRASEAEAATAAEIERAEAVRVPTSPPETTPLDQEMGPNFDKSDSEDEVMSNAT